jgi:hypothetical protein
VSGIDTLEPSMMNTERPRHFHASTALVSNSFAVRVASEARTLVGRRLRALQKLAVLGEQAGSPLATRCAMIRETVSRQLWSSLST